MPLVTPIVFVKFQDALIANFIATSTKKSYRNFFKTLSLYPSNG